jgi:leucyl aminopeptidase
MIKKIGVPVKTVKKKIMTKVELEEALINNFTNLQKVLTNLSFKFEDLSDNISKLLQLFEISAKSFAEKYTSKEKEEKLKEQTKQRKETDKQYLKKLDSLLDQNKTIAKGIMLMEGRIRQRETPNQQANQLHPPYQEPESRLRGMFKSKPLPKF